MKSLEAAGYTFEAADASFELMLREEADGVRPAYFDVESWRVITESRPGVDAVSEATVKLAAGGERQVATGEGNGPVNALDFALRKALLPVYPELATLELIDFKVRILDASHGTGRYPRARRSYGDARMSRVRTSRASSKQSITSDDGVAGASL